MSFRHSMRAVNGFTLIELVIVLALFALITTFTITNVGFLHRLVVRSEIEQLHMVCCYLQSKAVTTHQKQTLTFDVSHNSYNFQGTQYQLPASVSFGVLPHVKGPPATPTKPVMRPITFKNNEIVFHETGIIAAGTAYLVDTKSKNLYALTAGVSPVSFVRLYHYANSWQLIK